MKWLKVGWPFQVRLRSLRDKGTHSTFDAASLIFELLIYYSEADFFIINNLININK